jgi:protein TonB
MRRRHYLRRFLPGLFALLFIASVGVGAAIMISKFMDAEPVKAERKIQTITLLAPPPPPPQIEQKPPEPEIEQEKVQIPEPDVPDELPDEASDEAAGEGLGLDAEGGAGSDGFGLIGRKGGRGLLGGAGDPLSRFAGTVQKLIQQTLYTDDAIRRHEYSVVLKVWVAFDGSIERTELAGSTGNNAVDDRIENAISALPRLSAAPPPDLPMPIKLRITARL